jgi:hypothetical protein
LPGTVAADLRVLPLLLGGIAVNSALNQMSFHKKQAGNEHYKIFTLTPIPKVYFPSSTAFVP